MPFQPTAIVIPLLGRTIRTEIRTLTEDDIIEPKAFALGVKMHLPNQLSLVPDVTQDTWECSRWIEFFTVHVAYHPVRAGMQTGVPGAAGGNTNRAGGVGPLEIHASRGEMVQKWSLDVRVSIDAKSIKSLLVGCNKEDVRLSLFHN